MDLSDSYRIFIFLLVTSDTQKFREARSVRSFSRMITATTGRRARDFNGYGNWCGRGGSGNPVDGIDE